MSRYSYSIVRHKGYWIVAYEYDDGGIQGFNEPLGTFHSARAAFWKVVKHAIGNVWSGRT